jgi:hypothetical protein
LPSARRVLVGNQAGLKAEEGLVVCLENVMEDEPELLADIVRRVGDGRSGSAST